MSQDSSYLPLNRQFIGNYIINRQNIKFFIRILISLTLTYIIGHQFRFSDAVPNRKSGWRHRLERPPIDKG